MHVSIHTHTHVYTHAAVHLVARDMQAVRGLAKGAMYEA